MARTHVGIDVSKHQLDLAIRGRPAEDNRLANDPQGIEALCQRLTRLAPERIVVEATGGWERPPGTIWGSRCCGPCWSASP